MISVINNNHKFLSVSTFDAEVNYHYIILRATMTLNLWSFRDFMYSCAICEIGLLGGAWENIVFNMLPNP